VIIVSKETSIINRSKIGDTFKIGLHKYKIIGINDAIILNEIPLQTMIKNEIPVDRIEIVLPIDSGKKQIAILQNIVDSEFAKTISITEPIVNKREISDLMTKIIFIVFVFLLSIINYLYLYKYLLHKRSRIYAILKLVGCNKSLGVNLLILETFIISTITFILGLTMFYLFNNFLTIPDIAILYICMLMIIAILFISTIIKFSKTSAIYLFKNNGGY